MDVSRRGFLGAAAAAPIAAQSVAAEIGAAVASAAAPIASAAAGAASAFASANEACEMVRQLSPDEEIARHVKYMKRTLERILSPHAEFNRNASLRMQIVKRDVQALRSVSASARYRIQARRELEAHVSIQRQKIFYTAAGLFGHRIDDEPFWAGHDDL